MTGILEPWHWFLDNISSTIGRHSRLVSLYYRPSQPFSPAGFKPTPVEAGVSTAVNASKHPSGIRHIAKRSRLEIAKAATSSRRRSFFWQETMMCKIFCLTGGRVISVERNGNVLERTKRETTIIIIPRLNSKRKGGFSIEVPLTIREHCWLHSWLKMDQKSRERDIANLIERINSVHNCSLGRHSFRRSLAICIAKIGLKWGILKEDLEFRDDFTSLKKAVNRHFGWRESSSHQGKNYSNKNRWKLVNFEVPQNGLFGFCVRVCCCILLS